MLKINSSPSLLPASVIRRISLRESGPRPQKYSPIDYQKPGQVFAVLYHTVAQMIKECGDCCYSDLGIIPALSNYSAFQLERAVLTAEHHGLIKRVGSVSALHPRAPKAGDDFTAPPGIYAHDPNGLIDRYNGQDTINRALACRSKLEFVWMQYQRST